MTSGQASTTVKTRRRSFASSGLSYEQVARELGLRRCDGCMVTDWVTSAEAEHIWVDQLRRHRDGYVSIKPLSDKIHWSSVKVTRRGLFRFLKLASLLLYPEQTVRQDRWLALYYTDWHARRLAQTFRVRIPSDWGKREKARARLDLAKLTKLDTEFPEQRQLIRRVQAWTR